MGRLKCQESDVAYVGESSDDGPVRFLRSTAQALATENSFSDPMPGFGIAVRPMPTIIDAPPDSLKVVSVVGVGKNSSICVKRFYVAIIEDMNDGNLLFKFG